MAMERLETQITQASDGFLLCSRPPRNHETEPVWPSPWMSRSKGPRQPGGQSCWGGRYNRPLLRSSQLTPVGPTASPPEWARDALKSYQTTEWFWRAVHIDQWNRRENPEKTSHLYDQLIYHNEDKTMQWHKGCLFNNGVGKTGAIHAKEWNWTAFLYHIQE